MVDSVENTIVKHTDDTTIISHITNKDELNSEPQYLHPLIVQIWSLLKLDEGKHPQDKGQVRFS